jgi:hypothetical protein
MADKDQGQQVKPIPFPGGVAGKEALQGATFGFGEEMLAGGRSLIPGQPSYEQSVKAEREQLRKFESESPGGAMAAQLGGAVIPAIATAGMAEVPTVMRVGGNLALSALQKYAPQFAARLPEFIKSGVTGVEVGMKAGAGGAEKMADVPGEMATGGVIGGPVGATGRIVVDALAPAFRNLFGSVDKIAAQKIKNALEADKTTPEELMKRLQESGRKGQATLSDVGGENLRALMRVGTNVPGETRETATKFLNERQANQFARINQDVEETMLGSKSADVNSLKRALDTIRKSASDPLYKQANEVKITNTQELADLLKRMPDSVLDAGRRIYKTEGIPVPKLPGKVDEVVESVILDSQGNVIKSKLKPDTNDFRIYDLVKRGLDEAIEGQQDKLTRQFTSYGRALVDLKKQYLDYLDKANPSYGAAREMWAGPTRAQRLIDEGRYMFSADPSALNYKMSTLSPSDKQYFRLGAAQAVKETLAGKRDMVDKATALFATPRNRELLRPIFTSQAAFNEFSKRMETEMAMSRTRGYMLPTAGSKTTGLATDIGEFGGGAEQGALPKLLTGDFGGAALQLAPGVYGKTTGMTPEVASALQKSLLSPMVDRQNFIKQIAEARRASDLARRRQAASAKALTVPLAIPGATEQNR